MSLIQYKIAKALTLTTPVIGRNGDDLSTDEIEKIGYIRLAGRCFYAYRK